MSWSSNLFIRIHFILKEHAKDKAKTNIKEFVQSFKDKIHFDHIDLQIEPSGFFIVIDKSPKHLMEEPPNKKPNKSGV